MQTKFKNIVVIFFAILLVAVLARQLLGSNIGEWTLAGAPPIANGGAAPARDGNIAIREEFDTAVERNTVEAYDLFIRRHPDHPLADKARQKLERLRHLGKKIHLGDELSPEAEGGR